MADSEFRCAACGGVFSTQAQLQEHARQDHAAPQQQAFRCAACGGVFSNEAELQEHARKEHAG